MGDQSTPKIVGHKMPSSGTILARLRKDLVSPLSILFSEVDYHNYLSSVHKSRKLQLQNGCQKYQNKTGLSQIIILKPTRSSENEDKKFDFHFF